MNKVNQSRRGYWSDVPRVALILVGAAGLSLMAACQDPFKDLDKNGTYTPSRAPVREVPPPVTLAITDDLMFDEGDAMIYPIVVHVPSPGVPVVEIDGLPTGAVFDPTNMSIAWTPSATAGDNLDDPTKKYRHYPISVKAYSSLNPSTTLTKEKTITVFDRAKTFRITASNPASLTIQEGQGVQVNYTVIDPDAPNGPFVIDTSSFPAGTRVWIDSARPNIIQTSYNAGFDAVQVADCPNPNNTCYKDFNYNLKVLDPRGNAGTFQGSWRIVDVKLPPRVSIPASVSQGPVISIPVIAIDPNMEDDPQITLAIPVPYGQVMFENSASPAIEPAPVVPQNQLVMRWFNIPPGNAGRTERLKFRTCVMLRRTTPTCVDSFVNVHIASAVVAAEGEGQ